MSIHRCLTCFCTFIPGLLFALVPVESVKASWDGEPSLDDIDFSFEGFFDINAYQFRPSQELEWSEVENGFRVTGGSLDYNLLYLFSELRLKQEITPNVSFRLSWLHEEFYDSRELQRPLLELEFRPVGWPVSLSVIGAPEYAKREADLGLATTLGERESNYLRLAWLSPDHYYNDKNVQDGSYYQTSPRQLTLEGGYIWVDRYKLGFMLQDNALLRFVLDDEVSVFSYENRNYRATFDYQAGPREHYGVSLSGFDTLQAIDEVGVYRSQDIRYISVDGYWFSFVRGIDEWTVGVRYDDFRNDERNGVGPSGHFEYVYKTYQVYTSYHHPYSPQHAWLIGLYGGRAVKGRDYADSSVEDTVTDSVEVKLSTGWELFSLDRQSTLNVTLSWNLDEIDTDPTDGGMMRFSTQF